MKKFQTRFLISVIILAFIFLGYIILERGTYFFKTLDLVIMGLILITGGIAIFRALKKANEEKQGLSIEDELSLKIKYKAGYYSFLISMYMWLFIFIFKDKFPDVESMIGGGVLLSGLIFFIAKQIVKREYNEN